MQVKFLLSVCLVILFSISVNAVAPVNYNKELASGVNLRGAIFTDGTSDGLYAKYTDDGGVNITSSIHYVNKTLKFKATALGSRFKDLGGFYVNYVHISDSGDITRDVKFLEIDNQGFAYLTTDFSTVIIDGMTGTTTQTYTAQSGNQSFSVPNGSSYELNVTNNQVGAWESSDGKSYQNKSVITANGSMVTTESGIVLKWFGNLEGVNGSGDIGIGFNNESGTIQAIAREVEWVWDNGNVSLFYPLDTVADVNSEIVVLWGADNNTEPAAGSAYGSTKVWDTNYVGVWHMNNDPSGSAPQLIDLTSNDNDGTSYGTMLSEDLIDTSYGKGLDFDGNDDYFNNGASAELSLIDNFQVESYLYVAQSNELMQVLAKSHVVGGDYKGWNLCIDGTNKAEFQIYWAASSAVIESDSALSVGYHHILAKRVSGTTYLFVDGVQQTQTTTATPGVSSEGVTIGQEQLTSGNNYYDNIIAESRMSNTPRSNNYITTTHKNLNNPTSSGTDPFYLADGIVEHAEGTTNITATITGDSNTQSYNTTKSRQFTLTPTGTVNNVNINTTCTDYDITITTYWQEDTTEISQIDSQGNSLIQINYTPGFDIDSGVINATYLSPNFNTVDSIDQLIVTQDGVNLSSNSSRNGQDVNVSVVNLIADQNYLFNFSINYNTNPTVDAISDKSGYVGEFLNFTAPDYMDPEGLPINDTLWQFGDGNTSVLSNFSHIYFSTGVYNVSYRVNETATISPQSVTKNFTVTVTDRPVYYNISGYITDNNSVALSGVLVSNDQTSSTTLTNSSGYYNILLMDGYVTLTAALSGYSSNATVVVVDGSDSGNNDIIMVESEVGTLLLPETVFLISFFVIIRFYKFDEMLSLSALFYSLWYYSTQIDHSQEYAYFLTAAFFCVWVGFMFIIYERSSYVRNKKKTRR